MGGQMDDAGKAVAGSRGTTPVVGFGRRLGVAVVSGPSMVPHLRHGDRVLVRYGARVRPGDVVLVWLPEEVGQPAGRLSVKRALRRQGAGWWVEGDNPFASRDSRSLGPIDDRDVVARVLLRYSPLRRRS